MLLIAGWTTPCPAGLRKRNHGEHRFSIKNIYETSRRSLETLKGERSVSELAADYGVHPAMIHQWKKALLGEAADIFKLGNRKPAEVDEETVRSLHVKIGEFAVANDFLSRKLKPCFFGHQHTNAPRYVT